MESRRRKAGFGAFSVVCENVRNVSCVITVTELFKEKRSPRTGGSGPSESLGGHLKFLLN